MTNACRLSAFLLGALVVAAAVSGTVLAEPKPAFEGAEGFGAGARGGDGGKVLYVTTLDDDAKKPAKGSLRWAVEHDGPRIVRFKVAGNIRLKAPLEVREPFLTLDGSDAPGPVCLRDYGLSLNDTHDVIVRHLRLRRGDRATLKDVKAKGLDRPRGSAGLDTASANRSRNILFDHCSLSWSCDEIFGIVGCQNVTIQWCIIAEPLSNPRLHPYGDDHGFGLNLSANTLSLHHCLIAHYVMRGPQFECNDVRKGQGYDVKMEAINNVMFDYKRSGSRYTTGIENDPEDAEGTKFEFQFINNYYVNGDAKRPMIEAVTRHGVINDLQVYIAGNIGPQRTSDDADQLRGVYVDKDMTIDQADRAIRKQIADRVLFAAPVPVTIEPAATAFERVLAEAGCGGERDAVDARELEDVARRRFGRIVKSQDDVGGWPEAK